MEMPEKTRRVTDASLMVDLFGPELWYEDRHPDAATKVALGASPRVGGRMVAVMTQTRRKTRGPWRRTRQNLRIGSSTKLYNTPSAWCR